MERGGWKSSVTRMELVIILIPVVGDASYLVGPPVSNLFPVCSGNRWPDHLYECHLAVSHLLPCFSRSKTVIPWLGSQLFSPLSRFITHQSEMSFRSDESSLRPAAKNNKLIKGEYLSILYVLHFGNCLHVASYLARGYTM